jgi:hypothetical protein
LILSHHLLEPPGRGSYDVSRWCTWALSITCRNPAEQHEATGRTAVLVVWWDGALNVDKNVIADNLQKTSHSLLSQSNAKEARK